MAWVTQKFEYSGLEFILESNRVIVQDADHVLGLVMEPKDQDAAHGQAMMLRRAARRLEEIGKNMGHKPYVQPEDDPTRCTYDREAWRKARG
jgi:hypothetical protein